MKKNDKNTEVKTDLANKIAKSRKEMSKRYLDLENSLFRLFRYFSSLIDKFIFNQKYAVLISFAISLLIYGALTYSGEKTIFTNTTPSRQMNDVPIVVDYNSDKWEISGIPEFANLTLIGDTSSLIMQQSSQNYSIVADLNNLTAGTHTVKLQAKNFLSGLDVKIEPSSVTVEIKEKVTKNYSISYDFINTDKMNSIYALETPEFDITKVAVRASQDTLNSVAFVKALIDVKGVEKDFEQAAKLVAYDQNGMIVNCDIKPETVNVKVKVTSPNKTVPIIAEPLGEVPNNMAIESVTLDHNSVTVYAPESVLSKLDQITVSFDASQLTGNQRLYRVISLPAGVNSLSTTNVNMDIVLGEMTSKVISNVPLNVINNVNKYTLDNTNIATTYDVEVFGTQANIDKITVDDIYLYIDMANVVVGNQTVAINVEQRPYSFVKFVPKTASIQINVLGEDVNDGGETND